MKSKARNPAATLTRPARNPPTTAPTTTGTTRISAAVETEMWLRSGSIANARAATAATPTSEPSSPLRTTSVWPGFGHGGPGRMRTNEEKMKNQGASLRRR